jgi:proline iminopeptidase
MNVSVQDADLYCTPRGRGLPCLVLSAVGTQPYERQMPAALDEFLQLVFVDLRGGGRSTGDPAALTLDRVADDLEAIRAALGVPKVAVLGHSILGVLAIEYGRRRPESVSHVIAVGTPPNGDVAGIGALGAKLFEQEAAEESRAVLRENLARLPPDASPGQAMFAYTPMRFFDPRTDAAALYAGAEARPALLRQILGPLTAGWDVLRDPGASAIPTFLALGRHDYVVPCRAWEGVAERVPLLTRRIFERSGHQPFVEEPERFTAELAAWLERSE